MCETTFIKYKKRYLILLLASSLQFMASFQSVEYTIIANVIADYYNVSYESVLFTAIISMIANGSLVLPLSWAERHLGLRCIFVVSTFLDCTAAILKLFTLNQNLFWLVYVAQIFDGIALTGISTINTHITRVWFPQNEVARSSTVILLGNTAGSLFSAFLPVAMVPNVKIKSFVASGLKRLYIGQAAITFCIFISSLFFFDEKPKSPPSKAENDVEQLRLNQSFFEQLKMICSWNLLAIAVAFGVIGLTKGALKIMFNQMLVEVFNNNLYWVSLVAILFAISKIISGYFAGHFLDITHHYKRLILYLTPLTGLLFGLFAFSFYLNSRVLIIIVPIFIGLGYGPLNPTFTNFAAEVAYPAPESMTNAFIIIVNEAFLLFSLLLSWIQTQYGNIVTVIVMGSSFAIVFSITLFVKSDLKRQHRNEEKDQLYPQRVSFGSISSQ